MKMHSCRYALPFFGAMMFDMKAIGTDGQIIHSTS